MSFRVLAHLGSMLYRAAHVMEALLAPVVEPTMRGEGRIAHRLHRDLDDFQHIAFV